MPKQQKCKSQFSFFFMCTQSTLSVCLYFTSLGETWLWGTQFQSGEGTWWPSVEQHHQNPKWGWVQTSGFWVIRSPPGGQLWLSHLTPLHQPPAGFPAVSGRLQRCGWFPVSVHWWGSSIWWLGGPSHGFLLLQFPETPEPGGKDGSGTSTHWALFFAAAVSTSCWLHGQ